MKKSIVLKELTLVNFKGIKNLHLVFNEGETTILGANGAGKTSTFDAFTWLLFGKDSYNRKEFAIKTFDENGDCIYHMPHEVSAVLDVNGEIVNLRRTYEEKWGKVSGSAEDVLKGHEVGYFYNDVPLSAKEYSERINAICDEQTFMLITNPMYFTAQRQDVQRNLLFSLAGEISDSEIAGDNADFAEVVGLLTGKSIDDLNRELSAKKKRINDEMKAIPVRINEQQKSLIEDQDWDALQAQIDALSAEIAAIDSEYEAERQKIDAHNAEYKTLASQISALTAELMHRQSDVRSKLTGEYFDAEHKWRKSISEYGFRMKEIERLKREQDAELRFIENTEARMDVLRQEGKELFASEPNITEDDLSCPTCHRPFDVEKKDEIIQNITNSFNERKAERLKAISAEGVSLKNEVEKANANLTSIKNEIEALVAATHGGVPVFGMKMPSELELNEAYAADENIQQLNSEISVLRARFSEAKEVTDSGEISAQRAEKNAELLRLTDIMASRRHRAQQLARINELMNEQQRCAAALAELEKVEAKVFEFGKERVRVIESRINGLFKIVKFKLFETLLNGNTVECCYATVDGVPFSVRSTSERINMGLDIINAICNHNDVFAPVFIDNRETITNLLGIDSQVINLKVDDSCKELTVL